MFEPSRHPRRRGEIDRQAVRPRPHHDVAIPGIAVAPRIARQRERGTALRRRCLGLLQKLDPAREPRLIPNLPLLNRSEAHTSELQTQMRNSYDVFSFQKKTN